MNIPKTKNIYFFSDAHLGIPNYEDSLEREKLLVSCLDNVKHDAFEIYFLGDMFDFWFEYKNVVPKGHVRLLGKIAEIVDSGIKVHYFTGNHDMWIFDYFEKELGVQMYRKPITKTINEKELFIGHGDGLGPGDKGYKRLKKLFSNRMCQKLFAYLHPGFGTRLALFFSRKSRLANGANDEIFLGKEKERLIQFCYQKLKATKIDYFIFGHRHLPMDLEIENGSRYINTGDWFHNYSYAIFDGESIKLEYFIEK